MTETEKRRAKLLELVLNFIAIMERTRTPQQSLTGFADQKMRDLHELAIDARLFLGDKRECATRLLPSYEDWRQLRRDCDALLAFARHCHVAGTLVGKDIDVCAKCGYDLRHPIHNRIGVES